VLTLVHREHPARRPASSDIIERRSCRGAINLASKSGNNREGTYRVRSVTEILASLPTGHELHKRGHCWGVSPSAVCCI